MVVLMRDSFHFYVGFFSQSDGESSTTCTSARAREPRVQNLSVEPRRCLPSGEIRRAPADLAGSGVVLSVECDAATAQR